MRESLRALAVGSSLVAFAYAGCTIVEEAPDDDTPSSTSSVTPSTNSSTGPSSNSGVGSSTGSGPSITYECNPVTNEPCGAGQACDVNTANGAASFQCYDPPNDNELCETCGSNALGWCMGGSTCINAGGEGRCAKYCCDDGDCGPYGTCDKTLFSEFGMGEVGACIWDGSGTSGAGGGGGAGGATAGTGGAGGAAGTGGAGTGGAGGAAGTGGAGGAGTGGAGTGGAGGAGGAATGGAGGAGTGGAGTGGAGTGGAGTGGAGTGGAGTGGAGTGGAGTGGAGTGGAGTGGASTTPVGIEDGPVCQDVPVPPPSDGACVPLGQ